MTMFTDADGRPYLLDGPRPQPPPPAPPGPFYAVGLDLGEEQDYAAAVVVEVHDRGTRHSRHLVRYLHRWPLRTGYPQIVADVHALCRRPPIDRTSALVFDATGGGKPIRDYLRAERIPITLVPVSVHGGEATTREMVQGIMEYGVAKRDLVGTVTVLLQSGRLRIAPGLPEASTLTTELQGFQRRVTKAMHDVYGTWKAGSHDDTVSAVALASWYAEQPERRTYVY